MAGFTDADKEVRGAASDALITIGKPAVPALCTGLESSEVQIRQYAALTLGKMGPLAADAVDALRKCREDPDETVRKLAEAALRLIQPTGG